MNSHVGHLTGMRTVTADQISEWLDLAERLRTRVEKSAKVSLLEGKSVGLIFMEPSTRTRFSFEMAARKLGADVLSLSGSGSSTSKGETLWDTAKTLCAHGADLLVLRHKQVGSAEQLASRSPVPVVNAGDGINEHPTQSLLDLLTLRDTFGSLEGRTVAIVGDLRHSRVTRSNCHALAKLGARVLLAGPGPLCPDTMSALGAEVRHQIDDVLDEADAVMMLRIQRERIGCGMLPSDEEYRRFYAMTNERVSKLKPHAIVMHPGPMNRGLEIDSEVADSERSVVFQQKRNGVAVRMAILADLLGVSA